MPKSKNKSGRASASGRPHKGRFALISGGGVLLAALLVWVLVFPGSFLFGLFDGPSEDTLTKAEFSCYYYLARSQYLAQNDQEDNETFDENYGESIMAAAMDRYKSDVLLCRQAEAAGMALDESSQAAIDGDLANLRKKAASDGISVDEVLAGYFGVGVTEKVYERMFTRVNLANQWYTSRLDSYEISDEEAEIEYDEHTDEYDVVDYYMVTFEVKPESDNPSDSEWTDAFVEAHAAAEAFDAKVSAAGDLSELASEFPEYEGKAQTLSDAYRYSCPLFRFSQEDVIEWMSSPERVYGDHKVFAADDYGSLSLYFFVERRRPTEHPVAIRAFLMEDKDRAETLYAQWQEEGGGEEAFAEMAYAATADAGGQRNSDLLTRLGYGDVPWGEFSDWVFDEARVSGDHVLLKLTDGAHLLYFVSREDVPYWRAAVNKAIASERLEADLDTEMSAFDFDLSYIDNSYVLKRAV